METIGDAYMVASGVPVPNGNLHAMEVSMMSLDLLAKILTFEIQVVYSAFDHAQGLCLGQGSIERVLRKNI